MKKKKELTPEEVEAKKEATRNKKTPGYYTKKILKKCEEGELRIVELEFLEKTSNTRLPPRITINQAIECYKVAIKKYKNSLL